MKATASWEALGRDAQVAYDKYIAVGKMLAKGKDNILRKSLDEIAGVGTLPSPFIVLDGPSGVGKSQQFFALPDHRVIYMPIISWSSTPLIMQPIYNAFKSLADLFRTAVYRDVTDKVAEVTLRQQRTKDGTVLVFEDASFTDLSMEVPGPPLWTAGVIVSILEAFMHADPRDVLTRQVGRDASGSSCSEVFTVEKRTFHDVCEWVQDHRNEVKDFVFVIDELPGSRGLGHQGLELQFNTFARAIFRVLGITIVLAGTDSTLINAMGSASSPSRGIGSLWCITIAMRGNPTLPTIAAALGRESLSEADVSDMGVLGLLDLALNSRPWLAVILLETAFDFQRNGRAFTLDDLIDKCATRVYKEKRELQRSLGQWRSFESSSKFQSDLNDTTCSDLVVSHMAYLHLVSESVSPRISVNIARFFPREKSSRGEPYAHPLVMELPERAVQGPWHVSCSFPTVEEEAILHLILHNTATTFAFADTDGQRVSAITARLRVLREPLEAARRPDDRNANATSRDGDVLEAIVAVAWCLASHGNGLTGVVLGEFLPALLSELTLGGVFAGVNVAPALSSFVDEANAIRVPYLFAPEPGCAVVIPAWLRADDRLLGHVVRTANAAKIDMMSGVKDDCAKLLPLSVAVNDGAATITGECKNHKAELEIEMLMKCILCIPSNS